GLLAEEVREPSSCRTTRFMRINTSMARAPFLRLLGLAVEQRPSLQLACKWIINIFLKNPALKSPG
ncbi:MAG TPA: hypothetical protein VG125_31170, partial [Pirellulales bacterium]|nr:hypothetical protein [Pirellulales bacterium]